MPIQRKTSKPASTLASKPAPAPAVASKPAPAPAEAEEQGAASEADAFDNARPQGEVPGGKYEAAIVEAVLQEKDEKGRSARVKYRIATESDVQGQDVTAFYKLIEADGSAGKGAAFLKRDLAILGYDNVGFADLPEVFKELTEQHTAVVIQVKINGQWTNTYLQGLAEGSSVVADFLEQHPF